MRSETEQHGARGLDPATRAEVEQIAGAATEDDGQDPLDEATRRAIRHRRRSDLTAWLVAGDGFALLVDSELSLVVHPEARDDGLGGVLLDHVLEDAGSQPLVAWSHGNHPAAATLAADHGFRRDRDLWVMRLPGDRLAELAAQPAPSPAPADTVVRGYREGDEAELLRINAAAFASHPEQGAMDAEDLAQRMAEPWFDPAGLLVAEGPGGVLLGFHWTKVHDSGEGEVYVVGIDPAAQGRGLGGALTLAGLQHLARVGCPSVLLYVEADNAAAIAVYARLGFGHDPVDAHVQYRRG